MKFVVYQRLINGIFVEAELADALTRYLTGN